MLTVNFYDSFNKKDNSTKRPASASTSYDCLLKANCGIINPVLIVQTSGNPTLTNYCYIPTFHRYYWVKEWVYNDGFWECSLQVDVLATYKENIGSSTQYILRTSDSSKWDGSIIDTYYPTKGGTETSVTTGAINFANPSAGYYVVGIYGATDYGVSYGGITYYYMDPEKMAKFMKLLFDPSLPAMDITAITGDLSTETMKALFNPSQYIASVRWWPIALPMAAPFEIKFGYWTLPWDETGTPAGISAGIVTMPEVSGPTNVEINVPKHPQSSARGGYLNQAPYSTYVLHTGIWGDIQIPTTDLIGFDKIYMDVYSCDVATGEARMELYTKTGTTHNTIGDYKGKIAVDISLVQATSDVIGAVSNVAGGIGGAIGNALTGNIGGAITSAVAGIGDAASSLIPQLTSQGSIGSYADILQPFLVAKFLRIVDANDDHYGRPCAKEMVISTLTSGFIQCAEGDIEAPATLGELDSIKMYLTSGFFYE